MRRSWSNAVGVGLGAAIALATPRVPADEPEDEVLIRQGLELRRERRDVEALTLFQHAFAMRESPRARAQIALAEQSLGQWVAAESDLIVALAADDDAWIARNREALQQALGFVSTHLGWLLVSCNVQGARVSVNGASVGTAPMTAPVRVASGTALVRVAADGYSTVERPIRIEPNEHTQEFEVLVPANPTDHAPAAVCVPTPPAVSTGAPATAQPSSTRAFPWLALGASAASGAGLVVGSIFGVEVLTDKAARDQHCANGRCDAAGLGYDARARDAATISTVGFAWGAAALVASAWLFWRTGRANRVVGLVPAAATSSAGVVAVGVW
jgi:hypothetical protein